MADTKFTPGPWKIVPYGDGESLVIHYGQTQQRVCFMATPSSVTDDFPRIKANALLIASAPELYDAAQKALNFIENTESELGITLDSGDALRAALAKARGEA